MRPGLDVGYPMIRRLPMDTTGELMAVNPNGDYITAPDERDEY